MKVVLSLFMLAVGQILLQAQAQLKGIVTNSMGETISQVEVEDRSSNQKILTDELGQFWLKDLTAGEHHIIFRSSEYRTLEKKVNIVSNIETLDVVLEYQKLTTLPEIIITGSNKRLQNLQETAGAVTAVTSQQIEDRNVTEMTDLVFAAPNLMAMNAGSPIFNTMSIRGVASSTDTPSLVVYIDGVPSFTGYSSSIQLQEIKRIEILRGPQGTLYGQNAMGGVINIITKQPNNSFQGFAKVGLGNIHQREYRAGVSGPVIKDKLHASINGYYTERSGLYTNVFNNEKFDHYENFGANFNLKYQSASPFKFHFNSKIEKNNARGSSPYQNISDETSDHPYQVNLNLSNKEYRTLFNNSLLMSYALNHGVFSALTGVSYMNDTYADFDQDVSPADFASWEIPLRKEVSITEEIKYQTKNIDKWDITLGIYGFRVDGNAEVTTKYGNDAVSTNPMAPFDYVSITDARKEGYAAFGQATYEITPKLKLTAGIRYDSSKHHLVIDDRVEKEGMPTQAYPQRTLETSDNAISPKVNLAYLPYKDLILYATYARGFRPGGVNQYGKADGNFLTFAPEFTDNYELGFKSEWMNRRLRINGAAFYTQWFDQQQTITYPDYRIVNTGEMYSKGVELELAALLSDNLQVDYNFGWIDTEYQKLDLLDETGTETYNAKGNKQIFTPAFSSALSLSYATKLSEHLKFRFVPEWKFIGKQYMNYYNSIVQDPFHLININTGFTYNKIDLGLYCKNLLDSTYVSYVFANSKGIYGLPRTYGASITYKF